MAQHGNGLPPFVAKAALMPVAALAVPVVVLWYYFCEALDGVIAQWKGLQEGDALTGRRNLSAAQHDRDRRYYAAMAAKNFDEALMLSTESKRRCPLSALARLSRARALAGLSRHAEALRELAYASRVATYIPIAGKDTSAKLDLATEVAMTRIGMAAAHLAYGPTREEGQRALDELMRDPLARRLIEAMRATPRPTPPTPNQSRPD